MNNKTLIFSYFIFLIPFVGISQNNTFSPYSRYGLGEITQPTFAHNAGMGGAYIALKPDSLMPIFINTGNPAAYALIKITTLEVGGNGLYSKFSNSSSSITKWSTNFGYGAIGFPILKNGGACFGITPYSHVGYDTQNTLNETGIGNVSYTYNGSGGLNKAFIGYGIMPFSNRLIKFRRDHLYVADSLKKLSPKMYRLASAGSKLLSDFSIGFNANYVFGNIANTTRVIYPNSLVYNNTYRQRDVTVGDFTANFGAQTAIAIDSALDRKGRRGRINTALAALKLKAASYSKETLKAKYDSIYAINPLRKKSLKEKVKFTAGYFMALNNNLQASYNLAIYNYILNSTGNEIVRDTVIYNVNQNGNIQLPLEQGFGLGFKKGERINAVADFAITNWQNYKYLDNVSDLKKNYRVAAGVNFVPEKYAAGNGAFFKRINYRLGVSYQTGFIQLQNTLISDYSVTAGLGLPVGIGRLSSMVNLSVQYGQMGTASNNLIKENYLRFNFGFTFCDRWFQKFKYD